MGYEIKAEDIQEVRECVNNQMNIWVEGLNCAGRSCEGVINNLGMEGAAADSIKAYVAEIHMVLITVIDQMLREYTNRFTMYEAGIDGIDGASNMHITQDSLETVVQNFDQCKDRFDNLAEEVNTTINDVSDLVSLANPGNAPLSAIYTTIKDSVVSLNENVGAYENAHINDCESVKNLMNGIQSMVASRSNSI